ncbi:hypothetical protein EFB08_11470 [Rufibacter latericius]|uniref:Uncharacterized protein n=1 Tax=Rufibacter latericius TaxID=2487040 RepID=A0A3M9MM61_9BACT|nr:hypothetical protein EFB08_11470 [Rufibacter latericius]
MSQKKYMSDTGGRDWIYQDRPDFSGFTGWIYRKHLYINEAVCLPQGIVGFRIKKLKPSPDEDYAMAA